LAGRLEHIRELEFRGNLKHFLAKIGEPVSYGAARTYHVITDNPAQQREASVTYIRHVLAAFPNVSPDWLIHGPKYEMTRVRQAVAAPTIPADADVSTRAIWQETARLIADFEVLGIPASLHNLLIEVLWEHWDDARQVFPPREEVSVIIAEIFRGGARALKRGATRDDLFRTFYLEAAVYFMQKILPPDLLDRTDPAIMTQMVVHDQAVKRKRPAKKKPTSSRARKRKGGR